MNSQHHIGMPPSPSAIGMPALARRRLAMAAGLALALLAGGCDSSSSLAPTAPLESRKPNFLFVILDDVGIDQLATLGYGGADAPRTPTIDAIARAGVRFRNTWSMPECSPGRAALLAGRYPLRTNINQAIGQNDLAQSQLTPYDVTLPLLLKPAGYVSGMFGKFHVAGPDNNPDGYSTPSRLGWDFFYGWVDGLPGSRDTTAGGLAPTGTYACGYVPSKLAGGADRGACHFANGACTELVLSPGSGNTPGKACVTRGGLFVPEASCQQAPPTSLDFDRQNAYYVSPLVIDRGTGAERVPLSDPRSRGYRTTIETNAAIDWIRSRGADRPWMATLSLTAAHTPIQQPPTELAPEGSVASDDLDCREPLAQRSLQDLMIEALDTELGRLLVETGLAQRRADGTLHYDPAATDTTIVIVGDNGTLGPNAKLPFDLLRAKSTAYQTGIWVPLIVAGPEVVRPDRDVESMVNAVDVFRLFGELAGIDVVASVPRKLDAEPMLPYLVSPAQPTIRRYNFSQGGINLQRNGGNNGPCVVGGTSGSCSLTPINKAVCEDNNGVWWGAGATDPSVPADRREAGYANCCEVQRALFEQSGTLIDLLPTQSMAIRNADFKLVRNTSLTFDPPTQSCVQRTSNEFYEIDQRVPKPKLDTADADLLQQPLTEPLQRVYDDLTVQLAAILDSEKACKGDGNADGVVDARDLENAVQLANTWRLSSVYDLNLDGLTDSVDVDLVRDAFGPCPK